MNRYNQKIRILFLALFAFLMILSFLSLLSWNHENQDVEKIVQKEEVFLQEDSYLDENIKKDNPDTIGWITVDGTSIYYPVVQTSDNEYYLNHDFSRNENSAGWIFMDYRNQMDDQNLVIYGHHRSDGSMFGSIDLLFHEDFYQTNREIHLITFDQKIDFVIFSVYRASVEEDYINPNFDFFVEKINFFKNRSEIFLDEDFSKSSQIVTLSTCHANNRDRLVIHGYKKMK